MYGFAFFILFNGTCLPLWFRYRRVLFALICRCLISKCHCFSVEGSLLFAYSFMVETGHRYRREAQPKGKKRNRMKGKKLTTISKRKPCGQTRLITSHTVCCCDIGAQFYWIQWFFSHLPNEKINTCSRWRNGVCRSCAIFILLRF